MTRGFLPFLLLLCALFCLPTVRVQASSARDAGSHRWRSPSSFPNPKLQPAECGRPGVSASNICDPDGLLRKEQKDVLEGLINTVSRAEMALVIVRKLDREWMGKFGDKNQATEAFARGLHDTWGVGSAQTQNGFLCLLSVQDRTVFMSKGTGLDARVDNTDLQVIIHDMKPDLRAQRYSAALERVVVHVDLLLGGSLSSSELGQQYLQNDSTGQVAGLLFVVVFLCIAWMAQCCRGESEEARLRRGQVAMQRLVRQVESAADNKFDTTSCPICLEDFPDTATASPSPAAASDPAPAGDEEEVGLLRGRDSKLNPRRPMSLRCDHVFCFECLSKYLQQQGSKRECPICRRPMDRDREEHGEPGAGPASGGSAGAAAASPYAPSPGAGAAAQDPASPLVRSYHDYNSTGVDDESPSCSASRGQSPHHRHNASFAQRGQPYSGGGVIHMPDELLFRMGRMRVLHPRVMTADTLSAMSDAVHSNDVGRVRALAAERSTAVNTMVARIQEERARAASSGSGGSSSSSFGGGGSGGGSGGSW